jgi:hypothetical protein
MEPEDDMGSPRISWTIVAALLLITAPALAQASDWRVAAMGGGGLCGSADGGKGPAWTGGLGLRVGSRGTLEFSGHACDYGEDTSSGGRFEGSATQGFLDYVWHFRHEKRVQVFALVGAGYIEFTDRQYLPGSEIPMTTDFSGLAGAGGVGMEIFLASRLSLRPHFRGVVSGEAGLAQFLVTAAYRW